VGIFWSKIVPKSNYPYIITEKMSHLAGVLISKAPGSSLIELNKLPVKEQTTPMSSPLFD
jgi:hypothetical protein